MMDLLSTNYQLVCINCQKWVFPTLSIAGPHVKASCPCCGKYIKFVSLGFAPYFRYTEAAIQELTKDLSLIDAAKTEINFKDSFDVKYKNIAYFNLYNQIKCKLQTNV